jgi:hypothetical protein
MYFSYTLDVNSTIRVGKLQPMRPLTEGSVARSRYFAKLAKSIQLNRSPFD